MAEDYLSSAGLTLVWSKISTLFSRKTHKHSIPQKSGTIVTGVTGAIPTFGTSKSVQGVGTVTAGTAASLETNTVTIPNVTSVGEAPTLGTAFSVPNISKKTVVTSVTKKTVVTGGTKTAIPNLSAEDASTDTVKGVNVFTANTPTAVTPATVVKTHTAMSAVPDSTHPATLVITKDAATTGASATVTAGTAASLTTTSKTFNTDASKVSAGTDIEAYTSLSTGDSVTVSTGDSVTVGTPFSIPNVTSVGSAATLGTPITVEEVESWSANTPTAVTKAAAVTVPQVASAGTAISVSSESGYILTGVETGAATQSE